MTEGTEPSPTDLLVGVWTYRSFLNDPDVTTDFDALEFGRGNIRVDPAPMNAFRGLIYGPGWSLTLKRLHELGNPFEVRFEGRGVVGGEESVYDYVGYVIRPWPNGIGQRRRSSVRSSAPCPTRAARAAWRRPASSARGSRSKTIPRSVARPCRTPRAARVMPLRRRARPRRLATLVLVTAALGAITAAGSVGARREAAHRRRGGPVPVSRSTRAGDSDSRL